MAFDLKYFFQPNSPGARPDEIATLVVNNVYFSDWETVWVRDQWEDSEPGISFYSS